MHLAIQALSLASWQACHLNKYFKLAGDKPAVSFTKRGRGFEPGTNPASGRVEAFNLRPPYYNTSVLNHSAQTKTNFKQKIYLIRRLNSDSAQTSANLSVVTFSLNKPTRRSKQLTQRDSGAMLRKGSIDKSRSPSATEKMIYHGSSLVFDRQFLST